MAEGREVMDVGGRPLTAIEVRAQVQLIQQVMKGVMKKDVHYGIIPGCAKPSLWKPGAETIMTTFRLVADPEIEDLCSEDIVHYRVKVRISTMSGIPVGAGIGECSSEEKKYKWREAICPEEFEETSGDRRRELWHRGYKQAKPYKTKQVRSDVADIANTVLKMAKKRALVDAVLTATAASDIFSQDLEDIPEELIGLFENGTPRGKPKVAMPKELAPEEKLEVDIKKGFAILSLSPEKKKEMEGAYEGRPRKELLAVLNSMVDEGLKKEQEQRPKETNQNQEKQETKSKKSVCKECGTTLTPKVADYSQKHFGQLLCFKCQKAIAK